MTTTADFGSAALNAFLRAVGVLVLGVGAALAFVFAFAAALVIGLMIAGAAFALRVWPRRADASGADILEARRTPSGWVVESAAKRKS